MPEAENWVMQFPVWSVCDLEVDWEWGYLRYHACFCWLVIVEYVVCVMAVTDFCTGFAFAVFLIMCMFVTAISYFISCYVSCMIDWDCYCVFLCR